MPLFQTMVIVYCRAENNISEKIDIPTPKRDVIIND